MPVHEPAPATLSPAHPQVPEPGLPPRLPGPGHDRIIIGAVMVIALLGIAFFVGLPFIQAQGIGAQSSADAALPSFLSATGTTAPPATVQLLETGTDPAEGTTVYRSGIAYDQVYARRYQSDENGVQDVFSRTLLKAPALIECEMNPVIVSRQQLVDIDTAKERYITSKYPDPNAWLDLKVINTDTDRIVTTISFSKNYRGELMQTYAILSTGSYRFELTGAKVSPALRILVKQ